MLASAGRLGHSKEQKEKWVMDRNHTVKVGPGFVKGLHGSQCFTSFQETSLHVYL